MKRIFCLMLAMLLFSFPACSKQEKEVNAAVPIAAGFGHTLAVKNDNTVLAVGFDNDGQRSVDRWTDIIAVSGGAYHSVGLKKDGTVVAAGANAAGQCEVSQWTGIKQLSAGYYHTTALTEDGKVKVACTDDYHGVKAAEGWTDMVYVVSGYYHNVGITAQGTVVAVGYNDQLQQIYKTNRADLRRVAAAQRGSAQ